MHITLRLSPGAQPEEVRLRVPGAHSPSPSQAESTSQSQVVVQRAICVPQLPQEMSSDAPGVHTPSSSHAPKDQTRSSVQKRSNMPQLPHGTRSVAPGVSQWVSPPSGASGPTSGLIVLPQPSWVNARIAARTPVIPGRSACMRTVYTLAGLQLDVGPRTPLRGDKTCALVGREKGADGFNGRQLVSPAMNDAKRSGFPPLHAIE